MSLVEVAASLTVAGVAMAGLMQISADTNNSLRDASAGNRLLEVQSAAQQYLKANSAALVTAVPVGGSLVIPVGRTSPGGIVPSGPSGLPSLQGGEFLPSTFVDLNSYRQQHAMIVRQPTAGKIEVLITTTGGLAVPDADLGRIASKVGAGGGMVLQRPPAFAIGTIQGTGGGWSDTAASWTSGGVGPTPGHAVATLYFNARTTTSDYLNRYNTGAPEANRMHTSIDLNGFNISGANTVDTQTIKNSTGGPVSVAGDLTISGKTTAQGGFYLPSTSTLQMGGQNCLVWTDFSRSLCYDASIDAVRISSPAGLYSNGTVNSNTAISAIYYDRNDASRYYRMSLSGQTQLNRLASGYTSTGAMDTSGYHTASGNITSYANIQSYGTMTANLGFYTTNVSHLGTIIMYQKDSLLWDNGYGIKNNYLGGYLETASNEGVFLHNWLRVDGGFHVDGAAQLNGGATINGSAYVNGTVTIAPPTGNTSLTTTGNIVAGGVYSSGALSTGMSATLGGACSATGSIARSGGTPLWCNGSTWRGMQVY